MKIKKFLLLLAVFLVSLVLITGCNADNETKSNDELIVGEWTYTNGLAELEFDSEGNAAAILPSGDTTETTQYNYEIEYSQLTLKVKDTDEIAVITDIEFNEKDGKEYLTLSNLHDGDGNTINPTTATFEKLSDSTEAIK